LSDFSEESLSRCSQNVRSTPDLHSGRVASLSRSKTTGVFFNLQRLDTSLLPTPAVEEHRHRHHPHGYHLDDSDLTDETLREVQELREKYWVQQNLDNVHIDEIGKEDVEQVWRKPDAWQVRASMPKQNALGRATEKPYTRRSFETPFLREKAEDLLARCGLGVVNAKGRKSFNDRSIGQDNVSVSKLPNGWEVFIVCDGHGPDGDWPASETVRVLPYFLQRAEVMQKLDRGKVEEVLRWCFWKTEEHLEYHGHMEHVKLFLSGTTCTCCLRQPSKGSIWVAHVGDSTAMLLEPSRGLSKQTVDHTPQVPAERMRVAEKGCQMEPEEGENGEPGPERIYLPGKDYPGILMSRSMGDLCVKEFGVVAEPDVQEWSASQGSFYLACSDGVWEFLDNKEVADFVLSRIQSGASPQQVASEVATMAFESWERLEEGYVDDITVLLVPLGTPALPNAEHKGSVWSEFLRGLGLASTKSRTDSALTSTASQTPEQPSPPRRGCAEGVCHACTVQ